MHNGKRVLEVLLYRHAGTGKLFLPGNLVQSSEKFPTNLAFAINDACQRIQVSASYPLILFFSLIADSGRCS